jgi:Ca-activated chloride channel family protein
MCLPLLMLHLPEPAYAAEKNNLLNLWRNQDQQAMQTLNAGEASRAAEQFNNKKWKSSAYYRAGDYDNALKTMDAPSSSDEFYNKGNALAKLERYPESIEAYDKALRLDANNEDAAYNRELVKKALEQQQEQQGDGQPKDDQNSDDQNKDQQKNDQQNDEQQASDQNNEQSSEQQSDQAESSEQNQQEQSEQQQANQDKNSEPSPDQSNPEHEEQNAAEVKQALEDAEQLEKQQANEQEPSDETPEDETLVMNEPELSEDEQATEQWLKRIADDPGRLLRNKFLYQKRRLNNQPPSEQPW